ncbi:alpha/beta hydrolase [Microbacterium tumbae]
MHGWSQSHLSWIEQIRDPQLADEFSLIAVDLRGHGTSDAPLGDPEVYRASEIWAQDLDGVIGAFTSAPPVLVGWSYGGFVIGDYLRRYGDAAIAGVNFVDWAVIMGASGGEAGLIGGGFFDYYDGAVSDDLGENIAAMRGFVRACTAVPLSTDRVEEILAFNMTVTPFVRWAMTTRPDSDNTPELRALTVPVLSTQGAQDDVALPAAAEYIRRNVADCRISLYDGAGHSPFLEFPERFNRELGEFARSL